MTRALSRPLRVVLAAAAIVVLSASAVVAVPKSLLGDLEEYLEEAESADYAGRQIVITAYDGDTTAGLYIIEHTRDVYMVEGDEGGAVVTEGKLKAMSSDQGSLALGRWSSPIYTDRYAPAEPVAITRLGRDAKSVTIMEGDLVRATIVFDLSTGAPLTTEVYDGDGALFRLSSMLQFDPLPKKLYATADPASGEYDVMVSVSAPHSPDTVGGYTLADSYAGPGEVMQSFYTDGLFSFSLFRVEGAVDAAEFDNARVVEYGGAKYDMVLTPTEIRVHWRTPEAAHVLVGNLPPDHLEQVLADLPRPRSGNLLARLWSGLFG